MKENIINRFIDQKFNRYRKIIDFSIISQSNCLEVGTNVFSCKKMSLLMQLSSKYLGVQFTTQ